MSSTNKPKRSEASIRWGAISLAREAQSLAKEVNLQLNVDDISRLSETAATSMILQALATEYPTSPAIQAAVDLVEGWARKEKQAG